MSITTPPEQKKKSLRSNGFLDTHPIRFELRNDDDQPEIFIVDDDKGAPNLHLLIINVSDADVELPPIVEASGEYHFELLFRPGTLATQQNISIQQNGWKTAVLENLDGTVSVLMTFSGGLTIHGHETQTLTLQNVRANTKTGAHKSNVELRIGFLSRITIEERLSRIRVVNHRGQKEIPLHVGFIGSNTILNNGAASNTIRLRIANVLKEHEIHFNDDCHDDATKIVFSFDAQDPNSNDEMEWALGTLSQVENIEVQVKQPGWSVRVDFQGQTPEWILSCNRDLDLGPSEHIEIEFSNIISSISSGFTNLHIAYENVPGYWDGRINVPLEKSPIHYRDVLDDNGKYTNVSHVGIGTNEPTTALDVNGLISTRLPYIQQKSSTFRVGGDTSTFYPVVFRDDDWSNGGLEFEVMRPNVHEDEKDHGQLFGSMNCRVECHSSNWGHGSSYWRLRVNSYRRIFVGGFEEVDRGSMQVLWLLGNCTYHWISNHPCSVVKIGDQTPVGIVPTDPNFLVGLKAKSLAEIPATFRNLAFEFSKGPEVEKTTARIHDMKGPVMPRGGIIMWSGAANTIPEGWALCNGGTVDGLSIPDLRDRFVVGAGNSLSAGAFGDPDETTIPRTWTWHAGKHTHYFPSHWYMNHSPDGNRSRTFVDAGGKSVHDQTTQESGEHAHIVPEYRFRTGKPKWYALCFIIKL